MGTFLWKTSWILATILSLAASSAVAADYYTPTEYPAPSYSPPPTRSATWRQGFQQRASRGAQLGQPFAYGYFGAAPRQTFGAYHAGASGDWYQWSFRRED